MFVQFGSVFLPQVGPTKLDRWRGECSDVNAHVLKGGDGCDDDGPPE